MEGQARRYQDSDFWLDIDNVVIGPEIGKGQFSTVYAGKYFGDLVAVKKQIRKQVTIEAYILRELSVLKIATHENLVQYIGASNNPSIDGSGLSASYIVTELCVGGDLLRLLQNHDVDVSWKIRTRIAMQVAGAIRFLHAKNIIHRDIKSSNILLDEEWNCKLSDFGLARFMEASHSADGTPAASWSSADLASSYNSNGLDYNSSTGAPRKLTICGTSEYMPPEMLFDEDYSFPVDIFSFGMVIFETLTRMKITENDFLVRKPKEKFMINLDEVKPFLESNYPMSMYTLATQCTDYDPSLRPDAEQTVDWIRDVYEQDGQDSEVPSPHTTRTQSIRIAMSALIYRDSEVLGVAGGHKSAHGAAGMVFSPQPVPLQPKMSFTSPSGVFKSLFHSKNNASNADGNNANILSGIPESNTNQAAPLSAAEILLTEKYLLREPENHLFTTPDSPSIIDDTNAIVLKEGVLYKINETGFRNWKQIYCTLTETRLTWRSLTDPSKTYVFVLKDTTIRRTRDKRFMLSQKVAATTSKTPGKSKKDKDDVGEGQRVRAPTPDAARHNRSPSDAPAASTLTSTTTTTTTTSTNTSNGIAAGSIAAGTVSTTSSVAGSYGTASSHIPQIVQTALVQKELAAKSVEDMDDWIDAIQNAINEQKLGHSAEVEGSHCHHAPHASHPTNQDSIDGMNAQPAEEFESVAQWLQSTGLSDAYCAQYSAILEERGYDSMALINNVGLKDSDFDYLGIDNPAHRRALSSSIRAHYTPTLKLNINSFTKYESTVLFKVTSRYGFMRSCIQVQLGHFKRLDRLVRQMLHHGHANHSILQHLPALPSDLASRVRADGTGTDHQRRAKLELYLMYLAEALADTPHFSVLLKFLELAS